MKKVVTKKESVDVESVMGEQITDFADSAVSEAVKDLFPDDNAREQIEHNYGFSGQNIEEYTVGLENSLESLANKDPSSKPAAAKKSNDDSGYLDRDFIGGSSLREELEDLDNQVGDL